MSVTLATTAPYREPLGWLRTFRGIDTVTALTLVTTLEWQDIDLGVGVIRLRAAPSGWSRSRPCAGRAPTANTDTGAVSGAFV